MHIARTALITLGTSVLLWTGAAYLQSAAGSQPSAPLQAESQPAQQPGPNPRTLSAAVAKPESPDPVELTPAEIELMEWAKARFALVGLDLPQVDVSFHSDRQPCGGSDGKFHGDGGRLRVLVCIPDRGTAGTQLQRQRTLVHELAHAWEQASIDDGERQAFLGILDADDWYAPDASWEERGAERFAETIVWGLYDQRRRPMMIDVACGELHADFHAITGHGALGPIDRVCDLPGG